MRRFCSLAATLIGLGMAAAPPVLASTTYNVTRTDDPAPGTCDPGDCSLREAVTAANGDAAPDLVLLPAGTYTLGLGALPTISQPVTIAGAGSSVTQITGSTATGPSTGVRAGVAVITSTATITDVTLSGNTATVNDPSSESITTAAGALVVNQGSLTVVRSVISGNTQSSQATVGAGGITSNLSTLTLLDSAIADNVKTLSATNAVGGIANNVGELVVRRSTVSGNTTTLTTGTVAVGGVDSNVASAQIVNSTISGNSVTPGGAITTRVGGLRSTTAAGDSISVLASTVASNSGGATETANLRLSGSATVTASIIAGGGGAAGPNCVAASFTSGGSNLEDANTCGLVPASGDLVGVDPQLGPLQDNGGPKLTRAIAQTSPALDAVQGAAAASCPPTDQRGTARPQVIRCDIGAFELTVPPVIPPAPALPANTLRPSMTGTTRRGLPVTCSPGDWSGSPTFAFAWLRNGDPIGGATTNRYRLTARDVGQALECQVTATNAAGSSVAESKPRVGAQACIVPQVRGVSLSTARRRLTKANCRLGRVTRAFSSRVRAGRVLTSVPGAGANRAVRTRVAVRVSRGRRG